MACGEFGPGRMAEPPAILAAIDAALAARRARRPARARHLRPDPRADRPGALHRQPLLGPPGQRHRRGARPPRRPRHLRHRPGRGAAPGAAPTVVEVETAARDARRGRGGAARRRRRLRRRRRRLARRPSASGSKVKKDASGDAAGPRAGREPRHPAHRRRRAPSRPRLVIGFAAETDDVVANATAKRLRKGADWIVANDVSPATGIMGGTENAVTLITADGRRALAAHVEGRHRRARSPTASPQALA